MLVLNLPFKALMFLTLMRPSLVLFLVLWLKLVKDFLKVRCRLALLPFLDRKSGSAGMPRPISYAVFCLKKKNDDGSVCLRVADAGWRLAVHEGDADDVAYLGWDVGGAGALAAAVETLSAAGFDLDPGDAA